MEHTEHDRLWIWLSSIDGIDAQAFYMLIAQFEDTGAVYHAQEGDPRLDKLSPAVRSRLKTAQNEEYIARLFTNLEKRGICAVSRLHPDYPKPLQDIYLPPPVLYVRGRLPVPAERAIAVVGSRKPTRYGLDVAFMLGRDFSLSGVTVVSGLARGIDAQSHAARWKQTGLSPACWGAVWMWYIPKNTQNFSTRLLSGDACCRSLCRELGRCRATSRCATVS